MTVSEINPHVRFASDAKQHVPAVYSRACDCRLIYLREGRFLFECEGTEYEITAGTLLIWQAGMRYRLDCESEIDAVILNFDFTQHFTEISQIRPFRDADFAEERILERVEFTDCPALSGLLILPDMRQVEDSLGELVREICEQKRFHRETASAILKRILTYAARTAAAGSVRMSGTVEQVIAYIRENYARPITNREIAEQVNYHEFYVSRLMQRQTGMTLHQYLMNVRVENAARLLTSTSESAARIAELCGFTSAAHFSGVFHRLTGETPAGYRKRRGML